MIKIFLAVIILFTLLGCTEDQTVQIKNQLGINQKQDDIYGKYAYVDNSENSKMNGILELSYEKKSNGEDVFLGKIDVDRTVNGVPDNCQLTGALSMIDSGTYALKNIDGTEPPFNFLLKRDSEGISIVKGNEYPSICPRDLEVAIYHKYTKLN